MAIASVPTLLSLDEWAAVFGISPWRFSQLYAADPNPPAGLRGYEAGACDVWYQHAWQAGGRLAREDVADAIAEAEQMLFDEVGYAAAWKFFRNQEVIPTRHYDRPYNVRPDYGSVTLPHGYIIVGGTEQYTLIHTYTLQAADYFDLDGDGFDETWQFTCTAGGVTEVWELGVYYAAGNRLGEGVSQSWRIRPVDVVLDTATNQAQFTGKMYQIVNPALMETPAPERLDVQTAANFVERLDIYRRYVNEDETGYARWAPDGRCGRTSTVQAAVHLAPKQVAPGRVVVWPISSTCALPTEAPNRYCLNYLAGLTPTSNGDIEDLRWKQAIAYLSAALLAARQCCQCDEENAKLEEMRKDRAFVGAGGERHLITPREAMAGFGTRNGALWAWNFVNRPGVRLGKSAWPL